MSKRGRSIVTGVYKYPSADSSGRLPSLTGTVVILLTRVILCNMICCFCTLLDCSKWPTVAHLTKFDVILSSAQMSFLCLKDLFADNNFKGHSESS